MRAENAVIVAFMVVAAIGIVAMAYLDLAAFYLVHGK